jgi:large subunit ribosomal protein L9
MKVILLSDVTKVGKKYDLVDVAPGYARNFLFTKGLAEAVTKSSAKRIAELQKKREQESKRQHELLEKAISGMKEAKVTLKRPANEEGHLYAGVTAEDIAEALSKEIGAMMSAEHVELEKPLKAVGEFKVTAKVGEKEAGFVVAVEAE